MTPTLPAPALLDDWLARQEAGVPNLRPGCERRIAWAGRPGVATDWSVLFLHGFSASALELAPLPQLVARGLGANLHLARLTGHGQDGPAMGRARLANWRADTAQALAVAGAIGRRVLAIGCSTGCTLLTLALAQGQAASGVVMVSPNFGLASRFGQALLDWPGAPIWAPIIAGRTIRNPVRSPAHAAGWTTSYPVRALLPMAQAVRATRRIDKGRIRVPAFFAFADSDKVVSAPATHAVMRDWGGPVRHRPVIWAPGDDDWHHVMAGDTFSPGQTAPLAADILDWAGSLPAR